MLEPRELPEFEKNISVTCYGLVQDGNECLWEGDVDATIIGNEAYWECPQCGYENDQSINLEDYHDY